MAKMFTIFVVFKFVGVPQAKPLDGFSQFSQDMFTTNDLETGPGVSACDWLFFTFKVVRRFWFELYFHHFNFKFEVIYDKEIAVSKLTSKVICRQYVTNMLLNICRNHLGCKPSLKSRLLQLSKTLFQKVVR